MFDAQRIARKALLPLILTAFSCSALQAAGLSTLADLAPNEVAFLRPHAATLAHAETGLPSSNLALIAQAGDSLSGEITQTGNALEAYILQSGHALDASIEQYNALIEQTGTGHSSSVTQHGQGLSVLVRQYR